MKMLKMFENLNTFIVIRSFRKKQKEKYHNFRNKMFYKTIPMASKSISLLTLNMESVLKGGMLDLKKIESKPENSKSNSSNNSNNNNKTNYYFGFKLGETKMFIFRLFIGKKLETHESN